MPPFVFLELFGKLFYTYIRGMSDFKYGSVCSGIEAATVAWHSLGWTPAWFSEIEPFPCRVLKHHYPAVPNLGDMMKLGQNQIFNESIINLLVGGTPCQSFSLAGLRAGLASQNGNLALQFCRILYEKRPRWFVWENVPGVFSSFSNEAEGADLEGEGRDNGRSITETADFAAILSGFSECGYSVSWRVLDSQFFGVPQRRRRVFVVGHLGDDWRPSAAVLFEQESLRGNTPPIRQTEQTIAFGLNASASKSRGAGTEPGMIVSNTITSKNMRFSKDDTYVIMPQSSQDWPAETAATLNAHFGDKQGLEDQHINGGASLFVPYTEESVIYPINQITSSVNRSNPKPNDPCPTLAESGSSRMLIVPAIRRLTPLECERLQGFPDQYTNIPKASDGARYKALGNSMTTKVMRWIGRRIQLVDEILNPQ